jgi:hypothetical protein
MTVEKQLPQIGDFFARIGVVLAPVFCLTQTFTRVKH